MRRSDRHLESSVRPLPTTYPHPSEDHKPLWENPGCRGSHNVVNG